jgi:hypothetical protein
LARGHFAPPFEGDGGYPAFTNSLRLRDVEREGERVRGPATVVMVFFVAVAAASAYGIASSVAYTPPATTSPATSVSGQSGGAATPEACIEKLVKTVVDQGYELQTFLSSTSAKEGNYVCINVVLLNVGGRDLTVGSHSGYVTSYNITESDGAVVFQKSCTTTPPQGAASGNASNSRSPISSWTCQGFWSTGTAYHGLLPGAGTYDLVVTAFVPEMAGPGQWAVGSTSTITLSG